ncbi:MAG: hypothetical protein GYA15_01555 [Leptolinea sp.]|jgi:hypothetical protein|nr:hypothetical protein [Leptolinea sp.]
MLDLNGNNIADDKSDIRPQPNKHSRNLFFREYRYFLLPIKRNFQYDWLEEDVKTPEDLETKKHIILQKTIRNLKTLEFASGELRHKIVDDFQNCMALQIGAKRSLVINDENFHPNIYENWPNLIVFINMNPSIQKIWIQEDKRVFKDIKTIRRFLEVNLNLLLRKKNLQIHINPITDNFEFWQLLQQYKGSISNIRFELLAPNMSDVTKNVSEQFNDFQRRINSTQTTLDFSSDKDSCLNLDPNDETLQGFARYSTEGGGGTSIQVKGKKKRIALTENPKGVAIEEKLILTSDNEINTRLLREQLE